MHGNYSRTVAEYCFWVNSLLRLSLNLNRAAANHDIAVIQHQRLPRRRPRYRLVKPHNKLAIFNNGLARLRPLPVMRFRRHAHRRVQTCHRNQIHVACPHFTHAQHTARPNNKRIARRVLRNNVQRLGAATPIPLRCPMV